MPAAPHPRPRTPSEHATGPSVTVDAADQPALDANLLSASIEEAADGPRRCELVFGNWGAPDGTSGGFVLSAIDAIDFGRTVAVTAGADERRGQLFEGQVTGIEERYPRDRPPELRLLAEDRLQQLRTSRRTRTFEDVSDADVIQVIAADHGLRADVDLDTVGYDTLVQLGVSDLAFLRERARAIDAEIWVRDNVLHAQARRRREGGQVTLRYGVDLREFRVLADLTNQVTSLTVSGWDVAAKRGLAQQADEASVARELAGGTSGAATLARAFGTRAEHVDDAGPHSSDEARALAAAHFRAGARRFLEGTGEADGDARIVVGSHLELEGLSPRFVGRYYVSETHHLFDAAAGYRTRFRVQRAGLGGTP